MTRGGARGVCIGGDWNAGHSDSPTRWTERFTIGNRLVCHPGKVGRLGIDNITPPRLNALQANCAILWVLQSKEDDDDTDGIADI